MRLWTIHPKYLDAMGFVALWREGLLALHVLSGKTKGYRNHPQLVRFQSCPDPVAAISAYLDGVYKEAMKRGYRFDGSKMRPHPKVERLPETEGQLLYEWEHLKRKLQGRSPAIYRDLLSIEIPAVHPLFQIVPGEVRKWERIRRSSISEF